MKKDIQKIKKRFVIFGIIDILFLLVVLFLIDAGVNFDAIRDYNDTYDLDFFKVNINIIFVMFNCSGLSLYPIKFFCVKKYYDSKKHTLEGKFVIFEKAYFYVWLILSLFYFIVIFQFNFKVSFAEGKKAFLSIMGWSGTIFYIIFSSYLCIDNYRFCKDILRYKKYKIIFSKFTRSIITTLTSWLIILIFMYNNIGNKLIPHNFSIFYITLSLIIAFLYPLLDLYQYTFKEVEKHEMERKKREKEEQKYDLYNYD